MTAALAIALDAHRKQVRKGTSIPYIAHPIGVCGIVLENGGSDAQACAGLLHDTVEDGGSKYIDRIRTEVGEDVLALVMCCTDCVPAQNGKKLPWKESLNISPAWPIAG